MIAIINYNAGNVASIANMISRVGGKSVITNDPDVIRRADKLILPGVGHFDYGMTNLNSSSLLEVLNERVVKDKIPVLGICLGFQLFTNGSEEGSKPGLGWIHGFTRAFDESKLASHKIPHMGWRVVRVKRKSKLFAGLSELPRFYFVHSYHVVCHNIDDELVQCTYGYDFTAGAEHENMVGVQFHPEKSHKYGMRLMDNFIKNY